MLLTVERLVLVGVLDVAVAAPLGVLPHVVVVEAARVVVVVVQQIVLPIVVRVVTELVVVPVVLVITVVEDGVFMLVHRALGHVTAVEARAVVVALINVAIVKVTVTPVVLVPPSTRKKLLWNYIQSNDCLFCKIKRF